MIRYRKALLLMIPFLLCVGILATWFTVDCQRRTNPPAVPVYPGSTLVDTETVGIETGAYPRATYDYNSAGSEQGIRAFYAQYGSCDHGEKENICLGKASPFGDYTVYINEQPGSYTIEIRWRGCAIDLD